MILAGDYNVMPTDLDVYRPERWLDDALFRVEVREAYAKLVERGWIDAVRQVHPDERIYTFWDYFRNAYGRNAGLRIDHLLLNPVIAPRLKAAGVDKHVRGWEKASDHAPTWIELHAVKSKMKSRGSGAPKAKSKQGKTERPDLRRLNAVICSVYIGVMCVICGGAIEDGRPNAADAVGFECVKHGSYVVARSAIPRFMALGPDGQASSLDRAKIFAPQRNGEIIITSFEV